MLEEIVCDAMGRMNAFATDATERVAGEVGVFLRNVEKAAKKKGGQKKNAAMDGGVKYSIQFTKEMSWEEQLRAKRKDSLRTSDSFYLGMTPAVYGDDFSGYPLVMNQSDFKKLATEKHNVPNRVFKRLPGLLSNPVMSFYQDGRMAVLLDDIDADGKPLVAVLHSGEQMDRKTVTAVTSVYGIDNWNSWISNQAKKKISIYNEIRAESMFQTYGSNASVEDAIRSTTGIVSQDEGGVKQKYSREMDTVEGMEMDSDGNALSDEQKEFFRDSKVRDDEGRLIPVYHRTDYEFYTFKRKNLGERTLGNANDASLAATSLVGHWFSDHDLGESMGGRVQKIYLNIKRPYYTGLDYLAAEIASFSNDLEKMQDHFENEQYGMVKKAASEFVKWLRWKGYDGLVVNDQEFGGTSYIILGSEQAKLTSNKKPTTKRDIRYSREMDTVAALEREILRGYNSSTKVEEILTDLQWLSDQAVRGTGAKYSGTDVDAMWLEL